MEDAKKSIDLKMSLKGADEALEKLDALSAKLRECKSLVEEISQARVEMEIGSET